MERWRRTLYIALFVQLMTALGFSSSTTFLSLYTQEMPSHLGLSRELAIGLVFSAQAITMMLAAPLWGLVADKRGRNMMVIRASWGGALFLGLMAIANSVETLIFLRMMQGFLTGVSPALAALVAAVAPRDRSGYSMGLLQMSLWTGATIGPLLGGVVADLFGYSSTFLLTAFLLGSGGLIMWWSVEEEIDERRSTAEIRMLTQWREIMSTPGVPTAYSLKALNWMTLTMLSPFIPLLVHALLPQSGHLNTITGLITGAAAFSTTVSSYYLGYLSDRLGQRRILLASLLLAALGYFPQAFVSNVWQLGLLQVLTGVAIGGLLPTVSALLIGYTPPGIEGAVYGLDTSVTAASRVFAPLLGSFLVASFGLRGIFIGVGVIFLLGWVAAQRRLPEQRLPKLPA